MALKQLRPVICAVLYLKKVSLIVGPSESPIYVTGKTRKYTNNFLGVSWVYSIFRQAINFVTCTKNEKFNLLPNKILM